MRFCLLLLCVLCTNLAKAQNRYALLGTAVSTGPACFQLTEQNVNSTTAAVWKKQPLNLTQNFELTFVVNQCGSADGLMFILHSGDTTANPSTGNNGGALNYYTAAGNVFARSLAVELDIYDNSGQYNDPDSNHIALVKNRSSVPLVGPIIPTPRLANCRDRTLRLTWNAATNVFAVYYDSVQIITHTEAIVQTIFGGNPVVTFGFTGSTGGQTATQTVCELTTRFFNVVALDSVRFCRGDSVRLVASSLGFGATFAWSPSTGLSSDTGRFVTARPDRQTRYKVVGTDTAGKTYRDSILITPLPAVNVNLGPNREVCFGLSIELTATDTQPGWAFTWRPRAGLDTARGPRVYATPAQATDYVVTATTPSGCIGRDTVTITPRPQLIVSAGPERQICPDSSARLTVTGAGPRSQYVWTPTTGLTPATGQSVLAKPTQNTLYRVNVTDSAGCRASAQVRVIPVEGISALANATTLNLNRQVRFTTREQTIPARYLWEFGDGLIDSLPDPTHTYTMSGTYSVRLTITYGPGCTRVIELIAVARGFALPNLITPNGDGQNDAFAIEVSQKPVSINIYNRHGRPVYSADNYINQWGTNAAPGTYYYRLATADGESWKGWIDVVK